MRTEHMLPAPFPLTVHRDADEPLMRHETPDAPPPSLKASIRRVVCWSIAAVLIIVACGMAGRAVLHAVEKGADHVAPVRNR